MAGNVAVEVILRNVFRHKLRTALTVAAIVTAVAPVLSGGFVETLLQREATIHCNGPADSHSRVSAPTQRRHMIDNPAPVTRQIKGLSQVEDG
jgi:putative ABC transport system permease protein